ncbi:MAG: nicotinate phosphoribosyltransferase [Desulfobacterales bacterium]|jgi:nicotinate phosphoribosyltransferase
MKSLWLAGPLLTDLYEITMAAGYWAQDLRAPATFSVFVRNPGQKRNFFVAAGLATILRELENYRFCAEDIDYLQGLDLFAPDFLAFLEQLRFGGDVHALPEGTLFFPEEPILEITAPIIEAQLIETLVLNTIGMASLIATKAARCVHAAQGRPLVDFALRRTHGPDAGDQVARSTYLAGFVATSNLRAGQRYGIPVAGTMAHAFVSAFASELEAFRAYAATFPHNTIFLIDTYDTLRGAGHAATVALEMRHRGHTALGVRLDSGDMIALSREVRRILDGAGLPDMKIYASSSFDEVRIAEVVQAGAPIDAFGVGTRVGVSADAPYLDIVYKLVRLGNRDVRKLSPGKANWAGKKQIFRQSDPDGFFREDIIGCRKETIPEAQPLLKPVMVRGRRITSEIALIDIRDHFAKQFGSLAQGYKDIHRYEAYPVRVSEALQARQPN